MGGVPPSAKKLLIPLPPGKIFLEKNPSTNFYYLLTKSQPSPPLSPLPLLNKNYTQVMLILILIDFQYSQNAIFSFEKGSNH